LILLHSNDIHENMESQSSYAAGPVDEPVVLAPWTRSWLWHPALIVFISSACMMVLELVAGRIIAPYVGVSLYTWTSVIGVILAGMSLGNYMGGRLADRWASLGLLGIIFLLGGLFSLGIMAADVLGLRMPNSWPIVLRILGLTVALFFLPSSILGGVSPIVVKLAVRDLAKTGRTVGKISAAGAVGSIVGTFATGFWLISAFGTHVIVWGVAAVLLLVALLFGVAGRRNAAPLGKGAALLLGTLIIAGASMVAVRQGWLQSPCTLETNYFCIKVRSDTRDGEPVRVLILDRLVHSYSSLTNPAKLVYGYEQVYAEATEYAHQVLAQEGREDRDLRALFIGGGGYTFPRYMEAKYPDSALDVVEIDPGVTQVAHDLLGLRPDSGIVTYNEDARLFMEDAPSKAYNLIMGDAFNDYSVPYHLTTREFNDRVRSWLTGDGLYMVNLIDGPRRDFLRSYAHTLGQSFSHVYIVPAVRSWRESPRVTFVLIATETALDMAAFKGIGGGQNFFTDQVLSPAEATALLAEGRAVTLTDHYAPVDQMLAPVFRDEEAPQSEPSGKPAQ